MEIQLPAIIFQIVNIGIVVILLNKFAVKPVRSILKQRADKIEDGMKAAEANIKAQKKADTEAEAKIKNAQKEANEIIKKAKKQSQIDADEVLKKAKEDAKKANEKERQAFESMMQAEKANLNKNFAQTVAQVSEQLLSSSLSKQDLKKITDQQIKELKGVKFA